MDEDPTGDAPLSIMRAAATEKTLNVYADAVRDLRHLEERPKPTPGDIRAINSARDLLENQKQIVAAMHQHLFHHCSLSGPPAPTRPVLDATDSVTLVCDHDPPHRYSFSTGQPIT